MVQVITLPITLIGIAANVLNQKIAGITVQKPSLVQLLSDILIHLQFDANGRCYFGRGGKSTGAL